MRTFREIEVAIMAALPKGEKPVFTQRIENTMANGLHLYFTWRSLNFRIDERGAVVQISEGVLTCTHATILLTELIKKINHV